MRNPSVARRRWVLAWLGGPMLGIANGAAREALLTRRLGEARAHQVSTATAVGLFAGYFALLARRWPLPSRRDSLEVGGAWLAFTVAFELGFGRTVAHKPWSELLADYDVRRGRLWPVFLAWIAVGPTVVGARGAA